MTVVCRQPNHNCCAVFTGTDRSYCPLVPCFIPNTFSQGKLRYSNLWGSFKWEKKLLNDENAQEGGEGSTILMGKDGAPWGKFMFSPCLKSLGEQVEPSPSLRETQLANGEEERGQEGVCGQLSLWSRDLVHEASKPKFLIRVTAFRFVSNVQSSQVKPKEKWANDFSGQIDQRKATP